MYQCRPRREGAPYDAEQIYIDVELPFVPAVGTLLNVTADGDYVPISEIFLDLVPDGSEGSGLVVYLEEPDGDAALRPWAEMKSRGWKVSK